MSDLLKRIADYFANDYQEDDKTAPTMEITVNDLRYIANMNVERCRAEAELRNLQYVKTNADRIRNMSDEELAEFLTTFKNTFGEEYEGEASCMDWLQSEAEQE